MPRYAQVTGGVVGDVRLWPEGNQPDGVTLIPHGVGKGWSYDGETFAAPTPDAPTVEDVKAEAYRRIVAICPEWKQRNLTAQASILAEKGRTNWTTGELAAWDAGAAIWAQIAAIRAASDTIEALDPIPADYAADSRWP